MATTHNMRDGALTLKDTAGSPHTLALTLMDGTLKYEVKKDVKVVKARGAIDHLRKGDEQLMPVSFEVKYTEMLGSAVTPYEFLTKTGGAASYTYTAKTGAGYDLVDAGDVNVIQLFFVVTLVGGGTESIELPNFYVDSIAFAEGEEFNTLSVSGFCAQQEPIIT